MGNSLGTAIYEFIHGKDYPWPPEKFNKKPQEKPKELVPEEGGGLYGGAARVLDRRGKQIDDETNKTESQKKEYAEGGYTGDAPPEAPAGTVHGQEYVIPAEVVNYLGRKYFDDLVAKASAAAQGATNPFTQFNNDLDGD